MITSSAQILDAWRKRIEMLVPLTRAGTDDQYRPVVGVRHTYLGSRAILLTCSPGRRVFPTNSCSDWEFQASIEVWYIDQQGAYLRACEDADQLTDDLYQWVSSNEGLELGLLRVEPELANIAGSDNELQLTRSVRFIYRGIA